MDLYKVCQARNGKAGTRAVKAMVVYYSQSGNVNYAAEKIAEALNADRLRIAPEKAYPDKGFMKFFHGGKSAVMKEAPRLASYAFRGGDYDLIILGTPVWAGAIAPPLRSFIMENKAVLSQKPLAALVCCSGGKTEKAVAQIRELTGAKDLRAVVALVDPLGFALEALTDDEH